MATWKKILTDPGASGFDLPTTGTVGGLGSDAYVSREQGGFGKNMSDSTGLVVTDGSTFSTISQGADGDVLAHTSDGLKFIAAAASHNHTEYIKNSGDQDIEGSLVIHGNFECESFTASSFSFTNSTNTSYVLNSGAVLATDQKYGIIADADTGTDWNFVWHTDSSDVSKPGELKVGRAGSEDNLAVISSSTETPLGNTSGYIGEMRIDTNGDMYLCTSVA